MTEIQQESGPSVTLTDEEMIAKAKAMRMSIATNLNSMANDPDVAKVILKALSDNDKTILTERRMVVDTENAASERDQAKALHEMTLSLVRQTGNPFKRMEGNDKAAESHDVTRELPKVDIVPGQLDQGTVSETYDEFMTKFDENGNKIQ